MIASQAISQVKYTIDSVEYIGYTKLENRSIAKVFLEGEMYKELLNNCEETQRLAYSKDSIRLMQIKELKSQVDMLDKSYINCFEEANQALEDNIKAKRKLLVSKVLIVLLIVGVIIK